MRKEIIFLSILVIFSCTTSFAANEPGTVIQNKITFASQEVITYRLETGEHVLVFQSGFSMSSSAAQISSDKSVVWLEKTESQSPEQNDYTVTAYMQGDISVGQDNATEITKSTKKSIEDKKGMVVHFNVKGDIFITADTRETTDPQQLELYSDALEVLQKSYSRPETAANQAVVIQATELGDAGEEKEPEFRYPITLMPDGIDALDVEWNDDTKTATVVGRFYLSQKQEDGTLLEMQADNAVIFALSDVNSPSETSDTLDDELAGGSLKSIYLCGDVVMTEQQRTIRADEIYYDHQEKKAIVINAVMRSFDEERGIPIYVRAAELKQIAANKFSADDVTLTTSEFYLPQISFNASSIIVTDTTPTDQQQNKVSDSSYDVEVHDVTFKMYDKTFFYWPYIRGNMQRPDIPLKSASIGNDNTFGTYIETRWYLARLMGLEEPEGTDSTLALDYYGDRGFGTGVETEYERENFFGRALGYLIHDTGQDRLGRNRKDIEPERNLRGRFFWQHRHFLPYGWQLTTEASYTSDENFLESFYRSEFYVGKEQETLIYLKRIEDNWGISFLNKVRLNDFVNQLEELPTARFNLAGQSFFDDKLTFYSDSQISRFRQRYSSSTIPLGTEKFFSFLSTRNEIDMPMTAGKSRVVPFIAGTTAYEDGLGFYRELDGGTAPREDEIWFGEVGVRVSAQPFWKIFPDVNSTLWDLNQIRHIVEPHLTAVGYTENNSVIEQRDTLNVGISQRLQTKRGYGQNQRTVDWMRLDLDVTWINDSDDASAGPDQFIWSEPFIPLVNSFSTVINPMERYDRRSNNIFGPRRNYFGADYLWNVSDTTAFLSDMNYDMQSGVVQQFNVGLSHLRLPNLSYYVGSRYLRRLNNGYGEKGSNAFTFACTYILDPRYTLVYSGQFDFDYDATIRNDITVIRRYHRLYWSVTYSRDESMDRHSIAFSLWPQGVPDLAFGPTRYMGLGGSADF